MSRLPGGEFRMVTLLVVTLVEFSRLSLSHNVTFQTSPFVVFPLPRTVTLSSEGLYTLLWYHLVYKVIVSLSASALSITTLKVSLVTLLPCATKE